MCPRKHNPRTRFRGGGATPLTADEAKLLAETQMPVKFEQHEIDRIVDDVVSLMDAELSTRAGSTRTVAEVIPLPVSIPSSLATRTVGDTGENVNEELFYIVNFENDEGYSIIAADRRIRDEIALFVGSGNLDESSDNPGLAVMLSRLDAYAARSIAEYERWQDSVLVALEARLPEGSTRGDVPPMTSGTWELISSTSGPYSVDSRISPMIPVQWGQGGRLGENRNVFNQSVEATFSGSKMNEVRNNNGYIPAGCVPIATVQLMTYWKHPTGNYHGYNLSTNDWDNLRAFPINMWTADDETRQLCSDLILWVGQDIGTTYRPNYEGGSGAASQDAINFLGRKGYIISSGQSFNSSPAKSSLDAGRPVYMSGRDGDDNGHSWLIDGHLNRHGTITTLWWYTPDIESGGDHGMIVIPQRITLTDVVYQSYFHNNFGWHGTDNGYYITGLFDTNNGRDLPSNTRSGEAYNFEFDLNMWTNIHK